MKKTKSFTLDYYNKNVINRIIQKYNYSPIEATRLFLTSKTHQMLENPDMAMWEFSESAIFDIWESEKVTGSPLNSEYIRSEL